MGGIFSLDSKFMRFGNKFADLMWLNVLTLICSLPIVTIGASITAMHNVLLKIYRGEESYITKQYFKSFKENFKQSTIIFILYVIFFALVVTDFSLIHDEVLSMPKFIEYILYIVTVLGIASFMWVFILQSRYENKIGITLRNALVVGVSKIWYTFMMVLFMLIPILVLYYFIALTPVVFLFMFSVPGILQTMLYSKVFDRLEGIDRKALKAAQQEDDGWTVEQEEDMNAEMEAAAIETSDTAEEET